MSVKEGNKEGSDLSQFAFLRQEWPTVFDAAGKAESAVYADPRTACFYTRRALELAVQWLYKHDAALKLPYQDQLSALIHAPSFRNTVGAAVFAKMRVIKDLGNLAVHSHKPVRQFDAITATKELFHVMFWLARTYARGAKPADGLSFNPDLLPKSSSVSPQTLEQLQTLEGQLRERDERLSQLLSGKKALDDELQRLRIEVAEAKQQNSARPDDHNYSEAETRDYFIDLLLKEAGWALANPQDREFPVTGMPNNTGEGFVDYVLWGDDGKPLGLVEAKAHQTGLACRTAASETIRGLSGETVRPAAGDFLLQRLRPLDVGRRELSATTGARFLQEGRVGTSHPTTRRSEESRRRQNRRGIVERYYQSRAIRRVGEAFERDLDRKALLTMATGAGKTRTVIALCELLMRCNWVKRVLFLADRVALVRQAVNAFKKFLPDTSPVNLVTEKDTEGRVYVSTYPTMMGLIEEARDGQRRFGVGHFDLVIIDEAHRSVYQKYGAIFEYFDSLLVGLTATPKDEVDRNTYRLFNLETGVPTDNYTLDEAVRDGFLVPPKAVSVPLRFQREGISYDQLSEEEKEEWDALDWSDDGTVPSRVEAEAVNRWLFNKDTVDKVLEHLMTRGLKVAGGDRLGKTIIFAKNHDHAQFIAERLNINYPHYKGEFARVIDFETEYVQNLIDNFSILAKDPHIAISVDMLDTGIDIPEVVNLVFFKLVRSKTKFWQMLGRGTRLCPELFGPGKDKEFFYVFDYCQNLEFFSQQLPPTEGNTGESLAKRLFNARLELIGELDKKVSIEQGQDGSGLTGEAAGPYGSHLSDAELRRTTADLLRTEVAAMNVNNFVVRPKRRLVEKYAASEAWNHLDGVAYTELSHEVAGLPTELDAEDEEAKRFDLLMLNLQLAVLRQEPSFARLRDQVKGIAGLLQDKASIPMIQAELPLILDLQTDEWWQNVTVPMLETVRRRLRSLVKLIEKKQRQPIYTDFEDLMGSEREFNLPGFSTPSDFERFRAKARQFLKANENHIAVYKLRMNEPLTPTDLAELERMLSESGIGNPEDLQKAKDTNEGLGLFVRSLIGLDREAAKKALGGFLAGKTLRANQIEFLNLITDHLTEHGSMEARLLYDSPYTDFSPRGVDGVFESKEVDELVSILDEVRKRAVG